MRRVAITCGVLLMISAIVAAFAQGQGDGGAELHTLPPQPASWALEPGVKITPASRSVTISYYAGGLCFQDAGIDVQQTPDSVTITKLLSSYGGTDGPYAIAISCPTPAPTEQIVGLSAPLGHRVILDGSSSPPVQRYPVASTAAPDSIADGYARAHRRGLPITFDRAFALSSETRYATHVVDLQRVRRHGHKVLLAHLGQDPASPSQTQAPASTSDALPDFRGRPLRAAVTWADARGVRWTAGTPPRLVAATRSNLLANYIVTAQHPKPSHGVSAPSAPLQFTVRTR